MIERLQSSMIAHGALVFIVGLLAGFPFAFVRVGKIVLWPIPGAIDWQMPGGGRGLEFGGSVTNSLMYLLFVLAIATVIVAIALVFWGARKAVR